MKLINKRINPVYKSLFEINFAFDGGVINNYSDLHFIDDAEFLSQNAKSFSGLNTIDPEKNTFQIGFNLNRDDSGRLIQYDIIADWYYSGEGSSIEILNFDKAGNVFWKRFLWDCKPKSDFCEIPFSWEKNEICDMNVTFTYQTVSETFNPEKDSFMK